MQKIRNQKTEVRRQKSEDRSQKTEVRRQKSADSRSLKNYKFLYSPPFVKEGLGVVFFGLNYQKTAKPPHPERIRDFPSFGKGGELNSQNLTANPSTSSATAANSLGLIPYA